MSVTREELARLIASPVHNLDNKYGADLSLARASELADAILFNFDLVPKGSVAVARYYAKAVCNLLAERPGASHE